MHLPDFVTRMNPFRKKSDREVVAELRRVERYRRPVGFALVVLGLALLGLHLWGVWWTSRKALQITDSLSGSSESPLPVPADLCQTNAMLSYSIGFGSGLRLGLGAFLGGLLLVRGLRLRLGGRKARMLIQHFDLESKGSKEQVAPD